MYEIASSYKGIILPVTTIISDLLRLSLVPITVLFLSLKRAVPLTNENIPYWNVTLYYIKSSLLFS